MYHGIQLSVINEKSCRICLKTVDERGSLLNENNELLKLFEFCTGLIILLHEGSMMLCDKCTNQVKTYAEFKKKCLESNEIWESLKLQNVKNSEPQLREIKLEVFTSDEDLSNIDNNLCYENEKVFNFKYEDEESEHQPDESLNKKNVINAKVKRPINKIKKSVKIKGTTRCCGLCNYSPVSEEVHRKHLKEHWSKNDLKCNLCTFTSFDTAELFTHRYTHYPPSVKRKYNCHICRKRCGSSLSLEFHYRSKHLDKPGGYCPRCQKSFDVYRTWYKHYRLHKMERFICDICNKKFLYRHQIKEHINYHNEIRNYICETCGKRFKRKSGLKLHMESVHSLEPIKCKHCDKVFKSQITYKDHMRMVEAEKPYKCVHCGKSYHLNCVLQAHLFWHTGERPHVCDVCGLKYKSKSQLKIHKRLHTGYYPFKCNECDKCFTSSQPLKRHKSVHSGKRTHKCSYCERTFHEKRILSEHCRTAHKDKIRIG